MSSGCHYASSPGVIAQIIKSLIILLQGWGLPALAVTHFECSDTLNAGSVGSSLSLQDYQQIITRTSHLSSPSIAIVGYILKKPS